MVGLDVLMTSEAWGEEAWVDANRVKKAIYLNERQILRYRPAQVKMEGRLRLGAQMLEDDSRWR
jgi:hypothetical protein